MIKNTFIHLERIGEKKEINIWKQGVKDWNSFLSTIKIHGISDKSKAYYDRKLKESIFALRKNDSSYFVGKLPSVETWRLYNQFKEECCFLDIEVSGVGRNSYVTVLSISDGYDTKVMVKDINLDFVLLKNELMRYKLIITFNGSSFDIPFLLKKYPGIIPNIPHIDLRHVCGRIGLCGGLKEIEKKLGIRRKNDFLEKMSGGEPFWLWRVFRASGGDKYLKLLIEYNEEDVLNLRRIGDYVVDRLFNSFSNTYLRSVLP